MGRLAGRIDTLEARVASRKPREKDWSPEQIEQFYARINRACEERERAEAHLSLSEGLAVRRKELADLDSKPFANGLDLKTCEFLREGHRSTLMDVIHELEHKIRECSEAPTGVKSPAQKR